MVSSLRRSLLLRRVLVPRARGLDLVRLRINLFPLLGDTGRGGLCAGDTSLGRLTDPLEEILPEPLCRPRDRHAVLVPLEVNEVERDVMRAVRLDIRDRAGRAVELRFL